MSKEHPWLNEPDRPGWWRYWYWGDVEIRLVKKAISGKLCSYDTESPCERGGYDGCDVGWTPCAQENAKWQWVEPGDGPPLDEDGLPL